MAVKREELVLVNANYLADDGDEVIIFTDKGVEINVRRSDKFKCFFIETKRQTKTGAWIDRATRSVPFAASNRSGGGVRGNRG